MVAVRGGGESAVFPRNTRYASFGATHRRLSEPASLRPDNWQVRMTIAQVNRCAQLARHELVECGLFTGRIPTFDAVRTPYNASKLAVRSIVHRSRSEFVTNEQFSVLKVNRVANVTA